MTADISYYPTSGASVGRVSVAAAASSDSSTQTNPMPALGRTQPSKRTAMLDVGPDAGRRDTRACRLLAM